MKTWRKKDNPSIVVEAVRLNEANVAEVATWSHAETVEEIDPEHPQETQLGLNLVTPAGVKRASFGMYVVKFGKTFFSSHNRVFETIYEPVEGEAPPLESAGDARKERGFADPFDQGRMT